MSKSKFRLNEKVQVTNMDRYPSEHHLMGIISRITNYNYSGKYNSSGELTKTTSQYEPKLYDIHYGIKGIDDLKDIPEEDISKFE